MQKVKVKGHSVQKLEWKQTVALPSVLTWSINTFSVAGVFFMQRKQVSIKVEVKFEIGLLI